MGVACGRETRYGSSRQTILVMGTCVVFVKRMDDVLNQKGKDDGESAVSFVGSTRH